MKRIATHILFWGFATIFLTLFIGSADKFWTSLATVALMLPVAIATSYTINYHLFANYLFKGLFGRLAIYGLFVFVLSIYLEMMIVLGTFIFLANYQISNMNPMATNVLNLGVGLYFIVFLSALLYLIRRWSHPEEFEIKFILVKADRSKGKIESNNIYYSESLDNYVKIHAVDRVVITKEKISRLQEQLPRFIRIHRSFLINSQKVDSFTKEKVVVNKEALTISRTYKKEALKSLENQN